MSPFNPADLVWPLLFALGTFLLFGLGNLAAKTAAPGERGLVVALAGLLAVALAYIAFGVLR